MAISNTTATKFNLGSLCLTSELGSHCVVEAGPEIHSPLPRLPLCWDGRHVPPSQLWCGL